MKPSMKTRLRIYKNALKEIASGTCCGCCTDEEPEHCEVGTAIEALRQAEVSS